MSDAIDELSHAWKRNPDPPTTVALCDAVRGPTYATLIQQVGDFAKEKHASSVPVLVAVSRMYMSAHRLSDAQSLLVSAGKLAPRDGLVYRILGEVLLRRGDADRAEKVLERALQFGAADPETRLWLDRAKVFRPMQAKAGNRAVAAEVARTAPADAPASRGTLDSFSEDSTTLVKNAPDALRPAQKAAPPALPPALKAPPLPSRPQPDRALQDHGSTTEDSVTAMRPSPGPATGENHIGATGFPTATTPAKYSKDDETSGHVSPPAYAPHEDSVTFDLEEPKGDSSPVVRRPPSAAPRAMHGSAPTATMAHPRDILDALTLAGVFEPPGAGTSAVFKWDKPVEKIGRRGSIFLVILTIVFAGGSFGIFYKVREKRQEQHLVAENVLKTIENDLHASKASDLPTIEKNFNNVFELDSRSPRAAIDWVRERAMVGLLRGGADVAFEDGTTRAREVGLREDTLAFAQVASFLFNGDTVGAAALLSRFDGPAAKDPWYQLLAGATLERAGDSRGIERYAAASRLDPDLVVAQVALVRAMAIDGDPTKAAELAKQFRVKYPDRAEGAALVALAWARDPNRTEQAPPEANDAMTRATELPLSLAAVPHAIGAVRALDKHSLEEAKSEVQKGLLVADGPGIAAWLGSIAIQAEDEQLARKAALTAVSFSAVYPPARMLAARVALLGDRLDEALKATEELDPSTTDVAIVRAAASYERADADSLGRALDAVGDAARKQPALAPLSLSQDVLAGKAKIPKLAAVAEDEAPWADLVAMDFALDTGDLDGADKIAVAWKALEKKPLPALRLSRLARYEKRLDDAETFSLIALTGGSPTFRTLTERVFVLVARGKAGEVGPLLAKHSAVLGPMATWLAAYANASNGKAGDALGKTSSIDPPPVTAPMPQRMMVAAALGAMRDRRRGYEAVKALIDQGMSNPDLAAAGVPYGLVPQARARR